MGGGGAVFKKAGKGLVLVLLLMAGRITLSHWSAVFRDNRSVQALSVVQNGGTEGVSRRGLNPAEILGFKP